MAEVEKALRYRVNIKQTAKREEYFDFTVDGLGFTMEEVLAESDRLTQELRKRYPAPEVPNGN